MKDTAYAFAVGSVRARENALLTREELSSLVAVRDEKELLRRLGEKGCLNAAGEPDFSRRAAETWAYIENLLPDKRVFDPVLILNDFHNLKVLVKALIAERDPAPMFLSPSLYDPNDLKAAVFARENDKLPERLRHAHRSAYRILTKTGFSQLADTVVDRAALENSMALAREYGDGTLIRYTEAYAAAADLRVFVRCIAAGKEKSFMNRAVAETPLFDKTAALDAAGEGLPALLDLLASTALSPLAQALREKDPAFEAKCDAFAAKTLDAGRSDAFGVAPVLRYYLRAGEEIRNLRILLTGKLNNLPEETIRERMRWGYV